MKNYLLILVALLFVAFKIKAQVDYVEVKGKVINEKGAPISEVHVYTAESGNYCISNTNGLFTLKIPITEKQILFSHISYETKTILLKNIFKNKQFNVVLKSKINIIKGVQIESNKNDQVISKESVWVYDYEITTENNILILLRDTSKYELRLLTKDKQLIDNKTIPFRGHLQLIIDGLRNIYLKSKDSVYQYYEIENRICLGKAYSNIDYRIIMEPCVYKWDDNYYFEEYLNGNKLIRYFYINKETKEANAIVDIFDIENFETLVHSKKIQMQHASLMENLGIKYMGDIWIPELEIAKDHIEWEMYNRKISSQKIYSPLIGFKDTLYVFDFINSSLLVFNTNGKLQRQLYLEEFSDKKIKDVILDSSTGNMYLSWEKNGKYSFALINKINGKSISSFIVKNYIFPEKFRIHQNCLYFLYSDFSFNKKLMQTKLEQYKI